MKLLDRYLAREVAAGLLVAGPAICLCVAVLQAMRLLPLVVSAGLGAGDAAGLVATLCVPLSAVSLPTAAVVTVLAALARLRGDGELTALAASGASAARVAAAPAAACALVAIAAGALSLYAEPAAYRALEGRLGALLVRAALGRVRPGVIVEPVPALTVLAERRRGEVLEGVVIEDRRAAPAAQLVAATARLSPVPGQAAARLVLERGAVHGRAPAGAGPGQGDVLLIASFSRLELTIALDEAAGALASVLPPRLGLGPGALAREAAAGGAGAALAALLLHRRAAVAPGALALCLVALGLGLRLRLASRPWAVALGAALVLGYHLLTRLGEALLEAGALSAAAGGWLPAIVCWAALAAVGGRRGK